MQTKQTARVLTVALFCTLMLAVVWCEEQQDGAQQLEEAAPSQPQKRSVDPRDESEAYPEGALYLGSDDMDKRSSLFRFGKRGSLFRFGKRGSLFRFGKRGSLFRFGKRGSLFRFGKREGESADDESVMYPDIPDDVRLYQFGQGSK